MDKPIVLVDMDGVLADFHGKMIEKLLEKRPGLEIPELKEHMVWANFEDEAVRADLAQFKHAPGFFRSLEVIDGALEGWQKIIDLGYQPIICSSPLRTNPLCEAEKRDWLKYYLGDEVADQAIINKQKYLYDGFALIDDRIDLANTESAPWQQIIFTQSYNQDHDYEFRLNGWHDPNLKATLDSCYQKSQQSA
ncbi:hypothetical protein CR956_00960 [Candidatus Saccharibacteria bacterium]|nr:MAG: hypothetical protein CR956_00960 [Candidatus Saccharibacteria bacterium]